MTSAAHTPNRVIGTAQQYDWGSTTDIPHLLGADADGRPWAEWWLGTHPGAPSHLANGELLADVAGQLPFLLKLLAADRPLSLQTHPDAATAQAGWERENAAGVPLDHPHRTYRDPYAKPELLCALTPFDVLCGFRPVADTLALLGTLGCLALAERLEHAGLAVTLHDLYHGDPALVGPSIAACATAATPEAELVRRLAEQYPGEPSVVVTLLLHRLTLQPGEAVYLDPGNLHAYVRGFGVEIMGASDNVIRGGLTSKFVDVDELLRVVRAQPLADPVVRALDDGDGWSHYPTPGAPFTLRRLELNGVDTIRTIRATRPSLVLCTAGDAQSLRQGDTVYLAPGDEITVSGQAQLFVAE
jgi:mannose-6-phosphate isomerase